MTDTPSRSPSPAGALFDPRILIAMIAVAIASVVGVVYFGALGDFDPRIGRVGNDSFSSSAVGHKAFTELLERRGLSVLRSRSDGLAKADGGALLRLEPRPRDFEQVLVADAEVDWSDAGYLVVLPKRFGVRDAFDQDRARLVGLKDIEDAQEIVKILGLSARVVRPDDGVGKWPRNDFGIEPSISDPQFLKLHGRDALRPVVGDTGRVLIARGMWSGRPLFLVSDPDILANHGIDDGENAALAVALIETVLSGGSLVVVDETVHGFATEKDFWRAAFSPPYLGIALALAVFFALLAWRALVRFGTPNATARPFGSGKAALIRNTRDLLLFGGYGMDGLLRYRDAVLRDVAERANVPSRNGAPDVTALARLRGGIEATALRDALDAVEAARGMPKNGTAAVEAARALARWKKDILHGR